MGVRKYKHKINPDTLVRLLEEDPYFGRNGRIAAVLGVVPSTVSAAIKRLDQIPEMVTHSSVDHLREYRNGVKSRTGLSPKAASHAVDPRKLLISHAKDRAREYGREFDLCVSDVVIPETCPVLGMPLVVNTAGRGKKDHSPSIDRVDNKRGYTWDNIIVISYRANVLKNSASIEELNKIASFFTSYRHPEERNPIDHGRQRRTRKLSESQEDQVRLERQAGISTKQIAAKYHVSVSTIDVILRGSPVRVNKAVRIKRPPKQ